MDDKILKKEKMITEVKLLADILDSTKSIKVIIQTLSQI